MRHETTRKNFRVFLCFVFVWFSVYVDNFTRILW